MVTPDWADEVLSRDLPVLRSRGESQELEYKSIFPSNTRDLGKEIAAFASSNTGTILVGVDNSGELVGLPECRTVEGRDQIIQRLEGISKGTVKPSITPTAKFALEGDSIVLVIVVPKGCQPVYYCSDTPYIRHLTQARPAEPHEVIERVAAYLKETLASSVEDENDEKSQFYSNLTRVLADILVITDEAESRRINPWLDMWRSDFSYAASELRDMAVLPIAEEEDLISGLRELADALDHVANMRLYVGSGDDLNDGVERVETLALKMLDQYITDIPLAKEALDQIQELIRTTVLKLKDLYARSTSFVDSGNIEELQSLVSELARPLTRVAHYNIDPLGEDIKLDLQQVARTLHLTETMPLYMDGGLSMTAIIDSISDCTDQLEDISKRAGASH